MKKFIAALIIGVFFVASFSSFASDKPTTDDSRHKWADKEKFGTQLPIPGYREGMTDMTREEDGKKSITSKYPIWYRGTGEGGEYKEDSSYYYITAVGPPSWVETGLEANNFAMGTLTFKPGVKYPIHNHPAWEVYYVLEGEGIIRKYDKEYKVKPGDFFMNRPYDVHSISNVSDDKPLKVIWTWWTESGDGLAFYKGGVPVMVDKCWKNKETACTSMEPPRILKGTDRYEFMRGLEPEK